MDYGAVDWIGRYGYMWSRTTQSSTIAYYLYFGSDGVGPLNDYNRNGGFSLRWLDTT